MKDARGLFKAAGLFGFVMALSHVARRQAEKARMKKMKKKSRKQKKKMKKLLDKAQREMEAIYDNPPVRIPVPPNTRN